MTQEHSPASRHIFYSESSRRWHSFLGTVWIILIIILFGAATALFTITRISTPLLPKLRSTNEPYQKILNPKNMAIFQTQSNKDYRKLRLELDKIAKARLRTVTTADRPAKKQIRAGFYVNWDPLSIESLRRNLGSMNLVIPEWFFVSDSCDTIMTDIDTAALALMRGRGIPVCPMISNYFNGQWNGANVRRVLKTATSRGHLIASVLRTLKEYGLSGVNIDFEEITPDTRNNLVLFQKQLYDSLHGKGYLVTQDIPPNNDDYAVSSLMNSNDFIVLMAYDMHSNTSAPGPIADIQWVERSLDELCKKVPSEKIILGIPTYGYDWPAGAAGADVTFEEAVTTAKESEGKIEFNGDNFNLTYDYADDNDAPHRVWFTDAVSCFNLMRTAADFGTAGVALWKLGGEDQRIWTFFGNDMSADSIRKKGIDSLSFKRLVPSSDVEFQGKGEVLNIVATPDSGTALIESDNSDGLITDENYTLLPSTFLIKRFGRADKKVVFTFDDGPSEAFTPQILDILKKERVPAAFFIVGMEGENNLRVLRRIYDEGFEIGNHSFTHPNLALVGTERLVLELNATRRLVECVTGHSTVLFRPPYNADAEPRTSEELVPVAEAKKLGYYTVGESIDPSDWEQGISADSIFARVVAQKDNGNILLLHDGGGDRSETVKALPRIIHYFREQGYTFATVADIAGKTRNDLMPVLVNHRDAMVSHVNWYSAEAVFWIEHVFSSFFFIGIFLAIFRTLTIGILAGMQKKRSSRFPPPALLHTPLVSVIIPAHNEEVNAMATVKALLDSDYPALELIFVDDGSTDKTYGLVSEAFREDNRLRCFTKRNGGKATALNFGIGHATGTFAVCIDADTMLAGNAISELVRYFEDVNVGAVAGNVKVGNERSILTRWQAIEYITSQNFDRRAFDLINCIIVAPGAISAFRIEAVKAIGGFTTDTLAEDCDLTVRLLKDGWRVRYCPSAIALTEVPETIRMFMKQRFRWSIGILQTVWKHRDALFAKRFGPLGMIGLPNALIFQYCLPLLAPIADIYMVFSIMSGGWRKVLSYYVLFTLVDAVAAIVAFRFEKENLGRLWLLFPQRLAFRFLIYVVLIRTFLAAIRGTLVRWGTLKRTGGVYSS